jgi:hypothetical protein
VYITEQAGSVWVTDNTGRQWGPVPAAAQAVVRVAEPTGVAIGGEPLDRGPLPAGRVYTIHLGVRQDEVFRSGEVQRVMPPRPAKQR